MISDRCTRHVPVKLTMSGCCSHQRVNAAVHSWARRGSYAAWQPMITPQYTKPLTIGESSPAVTATMASSRRPRPSATRPCLISMMPWSCAARANRSASPKRSPTATASAAGGDGRVVLAGCLVFQHGRQQQVALLDAVTTFALDQPPSPADPALGPARLARGSRG